MSTRLGELVDSLGGQLIGDPETPITGVASLESAGATHITFLSKASLREQAAQSQAGALILSAAHQAEVASSYHGACVVTENPYAYYARTAQFFVRKNALPRQPGIHPSAVVDATARVAASASVGPQAFVDAGAEIGEEAVIGAGCVVGRNAKVGAGTLFHPRVSFLDGCRIGARCVVHSGAVVGGDGFGFANDKGAWVKIPQIGAVVIGDDVEIGANTCVDRGALGDTVIEDGVKLDNLIQVAHNVHIGAHTAIAGCVAIAGSTRIGRHCTIAGASSLVGHIELADHVHISACTLVTRSVRQPGRYSGSFPFDDNASWEKNAATLRQLHALRERVKALEKKTS